MKLIELYKQWMETGEVTGRNGLCQEMPFTYFETFLLFKPSLAEERILDDEGFCSAYWGSGLPLGTDGEDYLLTPLRETIVLLICAMHDEL